MSTTTTGRTGGARRALLVAGGLLLAAAPAASAQGQGDDCHASQAVESLQVALGAPPSSVRPGSTIEVTATVTRAGVPAVGVEVFSVLRAEAGGAPSSYAVGRTSTTGATKVRMTVPERGRGALVVLVDATHELVSAPCFGTVVEHGAARGAWGRVS